MKAWPSRWAAIGTYSCPGRSVLESMLAPSMLTSGPASSPPTYAASSDDRKIKVGARVRFVLECVMPPLALIGAEAAGLHERAKDAPVLRLGVRDRSRAVVRGGVHEVIVTAHASELAGGKVIERQVNRAAPSATRLRGHVALLEHVRLVD